ncbi:cytochrome P450 [Thermopolyspora sp. NPDC052614]|uniref:cytochrome P450 n=1 Tax=Thermopolyspora sp. NPDC052614 TaxID=3155682 RepID=UPI0034397B7E
MVTVVERWNIHPFHSWLRGIRPGPVHYNEEIGLWNVLDYEEVHGVLNDPKTFSSSTAHLAPVTIDEEFLEGDFAQMDPPDQTRYRKLVSKAFTPRVVAQLEPRIVEISRNLLDAMEGKERVELVEEFAYPLPVIVIAELLGIPTGDLEVFKKQAFRIIEQLNGYSFLYDDEEAQRTIEAAVDKFRPMVDFMRGQIADRRKNPGDDLLSHLVAAEVDGHRLTENEIVTIGNLMLVAGHITTTMLIGNAVACLDSNPDAFARVRADRSLVPSMLDETLRTLTPSAALSRRTTADVEIGGVGIPAETMILVWPGAANRDPRRFPDPETFDPGRTPNPHLGFGHGVHYCIGATLAKLEGRIAMNALLDRFPVLRTDPDDPPRFFPSPDIIGTASLPLRTHE